MLLFGGSNTNCLQHCLSCAMVLKPLIAPRHTTVKPEKINVRATRPTECSKINGQDMQLSMQQPQACPLQMKKAKENDVLSSNGGFSHDLASKRANCSTETV